MSGRGRGRGRGGDRGSGRGGGRGGRSYGREDGPPAEIVEAGKVMHDCEADLVCRWTLDDKVPYFNAGVYLENKRKIGKVDEILGKVAEIFFTVKMDPGVLSKSFQPNDLLYVGTDKLLPLTRFTNPGTPSGEGRGRGGGVGFRGGRGGRGGGRSPAGRFGGRSGRAGRSPGRGRGGGGGRGFSPGRGRGRGRQ